MLLASSNFNYTEVSISPLSSSLRRSVAEFWLTSMLHEVKCLEKYYYNHNSSVGYIIPYYILTILYLAFYIQPTTMLGWLRLAELLGHGCLWPIVGVDDRLCWDYVVSSWNNLDNMTGTWDHHLEGGARDCLSNLAGCSLLIRSSVNFLKVFFSGVSSESTLVQFRTLCRKSEGLLCQTAL